MNTLVRKLYEVKGFDKKQKKDEIAYVIANSEDDAISKCTFLENPTLTGKVENLGPGW